jgi:hypothetical protein
MYGLAGLLLSCIALAACGAPPHLAAGSFGWASYVDPAIGVSLWYPDVYAPQAASDGSYVPFRYGRFTPLIIRFVDEKDGKQRGLWFGSVPTGAIQVGGIVGQEYIYTHYDGPFGARMIACVVPWKGKYLGIEFRTNGDLDSAQQEILRRVALSNP